MAKNVSLQFEISAKGADETAKQIGDLSHSVQDLGEVTGQTAETTKAVVEANQDMSTSVEGATKAVESARTVIENTNQEISTSSQTAAKAAESAGGTIGKANQDIATSAKKAANGISELGQKTEETAGQAGALRDIVSNLQLQNLQKLNETYSKLVSAVEDYSKKALVAAASNEKYEKSLVHLTKNAAKAKEIADYANSLNVPWDTGSIQKAIKKIVEFRGTAQEVFPIVSELAAGTEQDIVSTAEVVTKTLQGDSAAVKQLSKTFGISGAELGKFGATLSANGEVIVRSSQDIENLKKALGSLVNSKYGLALEEQTSTLAGQWDGVEKSWAQFTSMLGEAFLPAAKQAIAALAQVTNYLVGLSPSTKAAIAWIGGIVAALLVLVGAIGSGMLALGQLVGTFGLAQTTLSATLVSLKAAAASMGLLSMSTVAATAAFAAFVVAVAAATALAREWNKNAEEIDNRENVLGKGVKAGQKDIDNLRESLKKLGTETNSLNAGTKVLEKYRELGEGAAAAFKKAGISLSSINQLLVAQRGQLEANLGSLFDLQEQINTPEKQAALGTEETAAIQKKIENLQELIAIQKESILNAKKLSKELSSSKTTSGSSPEEGKKAVDDMVAGLEKAREEREKAAVAAKEEAEETERSAKAEEEKAKAAAAAEKAISTINNSDSMLGGETLEQEVANLEKAEKYLKDMLSSSKLLNESAEAHEKITSRINELEQQRLDKIKEMRRIEEKAANARQQAEERLDQDRINELSHLEKTKAAVEELAALKKKQAEREIADNNKKWEKETANLEKHSKAYQDFTLARNRSNELVTKQLERDLANLNKDYEEYTIKKLAEAQKQDTSTKTPDEKAVEEVKTNLPAKQQIIASNDDLSVFNSNLDLASRGMNGLTAAVVGAANVLSDGTKEIQGGISTTISSLGQLSLAIRSAAEGAGEGAKITSEVDADSNTNDNSTYYINIDSNSIQDKTTSKEIASIANRVINERRYTERVYGGV